MGVHERKGGLTVAEGGGAAVGGAVNGWLAFNKWLNKAVRAADDIYGAYTEFVDMVDAIFTRFRRVFVPGCMRRRARIG